jgi:hypothetical protein
MQLKTKKLIAREFIFFIITALLVLITFACTYFYNYTQNSNATKFDAVILNRTAMADSLAKPYKTKLKNQQWFYDKNNEIVDLKNTEFNSPSKLWQRLDYLAAADSIKIKIDSFWTPEIKALLVTIDFDNPEKLTAFIDKNRITQDDSTDYNKSVLTTADVGKLKKERALYSAKILSTNQQFQFTLWISLIFFIALFGLRYLFYAIRWSIKILKQQG